MNHNLFVVKNSLLTPIKFGVDKRRVIIIKSLQMPARKKTTIIEESPPLTAPVTSGKTIFPLDSVDTLVAKLLETKTQLEKLEKEVAETKKNWAVSQQDLETARKREQETYQYETSLARRQAEDEFAAKKDRWEKELADRKEEIETDKKELARLQKLVESFPAEKEKAIADATSTLQKTLSEQFAHEKALREQENKSKESILTLKIENLEAETARQTKEIETLKKSLEEATRQVKDVAVKVIESRNQTQTPTTVS